MRPPAHSELPARNRHWLKECQKAYDRAVERTLKEDRNIEDVFEYAASLAAESRKITDLRWIDEMRGFVEDMVQHDYSLDTGSRKSYKFHFVSGYIFSHVAAEILDEMEADKVLHYVNDNWDLFTPDA